MSKRAQDATIEARIENEAIVDAHDSEEQAMGWYYYLEDKLHTPFTAECFLMRKTSPLNPGEVVTVKGMADVDECEKEMFVTIEWQGRELAVPLMQLKVLEAAADIVEGVGDWHYWVERGYRF